VQPDRFQARMLCESLGAHIPEDIVVAESLDDALAAIDRGLPDVVLLPTLMPAAVEDYLITYLGAIPGAGHVRILGLPRLERSDNDIRPLARSLFAWPWRQDPQPVAKVTCDPGIFTRDVVGYLADARTIREQLLTEEIQSFSEDPSGKRAERRNGRRFAKIEVPWISVVRFGREQADLINVSSRGALLRTDRRPEYRLMRRSEPNVRERPRLTLALESDREVHALGRVIRCVRVTAGGHPHYEIAFSFDDTVGLHLPVAGELVRVLEGVRTRGE